MAETFQQMLQRVKRSIQEISIAETQAELHNGKAPVLLDIRERDEYEEGAIKGAIHIPRGNLELRIEGAVPDRGQPIVLYCAGGVRSALAAQALETLGYEDVKSMAGGFGAWKNAGYAYVVPR